MFIGRERELNVLEKLYSSNKFEFAVIYGRRRVGKTAIINRFLENKKAIYFMGVESNAKQNLENLSKSIIEYSNGIETETSFLSFQAALEYVFKLAEKERLILAIDEYPYVARSSKSLASTLQLLIDRYNDSSKLMLILCGSSMSYMEDHVLAYKAPLYGRRTAQMKILPFDFEETCRCFKRLSAACAVGVVWSIYIPELSGSGMVAGANGVLDSVGYALASLSSLAFSALIGVIGWRGLIAVWTALMFAASVIIVFNLGIKANTLRTDGK